MPNILFHLVHPAHFHLFYPIICSFKKKGWKIVITIRNKDVLNNLLDESNLEYISIKSLIETNSKLALLPNLVFKVYHLFKICFSHQINIMASSAPEVAVTARLLQIPSILFFEDDLEYVKLWSYTAGPFAKLLMCPESCSASRWEYKTIKYNGYHELTTLHTKYFKPYKKNIEGLVTNSDEKYFLIRLAKLTAHHDFGKKGITKEITEKLINILEKHGRVYITSERELETEFEPYRINVDPLHIHHVMAFATLYIGDSQTMAAEAAVLGTPSIRFNDFVGKLGYLEELEHKYGLTFGIKTSEPEKLFHKVEELLAKPNLRDEWQNKRQKMLSEKIDVTEFMVWLIENYPNSVSVMKENPSYQFNFK